MCEIIFMQSANELVTVCFHSTFTVKLQEHETTWIVQPFFTLWYQKAATATSLCLWLLWYE